MGRKWKASIKHGIIRRPVRSDCRGTMGVKQDLAFT